MSFRDTNYILFTKINVDIIINTPTQQIVQVKKNSNMKMLE